MLDERGLYRVGVVGRAEAFDGGDGFVLSVDGENAATIDRFAVKQARVARGAGMTLQIEFGAG